MIVGTAHPLTRRVLIVDDELVAATTAGGHAVRTLAAEMRGRGMEVVEALSVEDGLNQVVSDAALHCVFLNWTIGKNDRSEHAQATELLRKLRTRNAKVPVFLMADRKVAGTVTIEVATLADEFVWVLEDTAAFVVGRAAAAIERYIQALLPPYAAALARYDRDREYSWAAPGHQGGVAFLKSPVGRAFFDYFGENLFRSDMGIERGALGSLLGHTRPGGRERTIRGPRLRRASLLLGAERDLGVEPGDHVGVRRRRRDRAVRPQLPQVHRARFGPHGRDSRILASYAKPLRHHRTDPAGAARAGIDHQGDR